VASAGGSRRARARDARATPPVKQVIGSRLFTRFEMLDVSEEETTDASARARDLARRVVRDAVRVLGRKKVARRHAPEKSAHADAPGNVQPVVRVSAPRAQSASTRRHRVASLARGESRFPCSEADSRRDENENGLGLVSRRFAAAAASSVVSVVALGGFADPALAGFGAPTGVVSSPPLPEEQLAEIISMDRRAAIRKTSLIRTSDFDILLQELNALTQLDEKALEAADAEIALKISENLAENIRDATESLRTAPAPAAGAAREGELSSQRVRLLERRRLEAEFQKKLLQRKVDEARLENQSQLIVYGAALGASVLSTVMMHPVDTVKVRKQALGAEKLAATTAAELVGDAAEETAFAVASAATVAASAAVDARVVAAAEGGPEASFDAFDDGPVTLRGSEPGPLSGARGDEPAAFPSASAAVATVTVARAREDGEGANRGDRGDSASPFGSLDRAFEELESAYGVEASAYEEAQMPMSSALAAAALSAPSAPIFEPLGVPLTPAGLASLYDGLLPNIVKEGPPLAMYLGIYEYLKAILLATDLRDSPVACYLIAGAVGELIGSVLRVPAEAVKSTQQSKEDISLSEAMSLNFGTAEGRANCVAAWTVAVTRDVPFGAIQIALFEALKIYLSGVADPPFDGDSFVGEAILGAFGGGVGAFISAPMDVVVVRLIKQQAAGEAEKLGAVGMAKLVYEEGGAAAFFRGSGERVLYWAPAIGIFLTAYCRIRHALL
jgi:hypothetical protein